MFSAKLALLLILVSFSFPRAIYSIEINCRIALLKIFSSKGLWEKTNEVSELGTNGEVTITISDDRGNKISIPVKFSVKATLPKTTAERAEVFDGMQNPIKLALKELTDSELTDPAVEKIAFDTTKRFLPQLLGGLLSARKGKDNEATRIFSLFGYLRGEDMIRFHERAMIDTFLRDDIGYFSPGHGIAGGDYVGIRLSRHAVSKEGNFGVRLYLELQPLIDGYAKLIRARPDVKTIYLSSCQAGLSGDGKISAAHRVAKATGRDVIAPNGDVIYYFSPSRRQHQFQVNAPGNDSKILSRDKAFSVFRPDGTVVPISFQEAMAMMGKSGSDIQYGLLREHTDE